MAAPAKATHRDEPHAISGRPRPKADAALLLDRVAAHDLTTVARLLGEGVPDEAGVAALVRAAALCDVEMVNLLANGSVVDKLEPLSGLTPLMAAAEKCAEPEGTAIAQRLLTRGAQLNTRDRAGCAAAHHARKESMVAFLVKHDVNPDSKCKNEDETTPLQLAVRDLDADRVDAWLASGARVDNVGAHGVPWVWGLVKDRRDRAARLRVIKALFQKKAPLDAAPPNRAAPVLEAVLDGDYELAGALVKLGADVRPLVARLETIYMKPPPTALDLCQVIDATRGAPADALALCTVAACGLRRAAVAREYAARLESKGDYLKNACARNGIEL